MEKEKGGGGGGVGGGGDDDIGLPSVRPAAAAAAAAAAAEDDDVKKWEEQQAVAAEKARLMAKVPKGWDVKVTRRKGAKAKGFFSKFTSPKGEVFRSMKEIQKHLEVKARAISSKEQPAFVWTNMHLTAEGFLLRAHTSRLARPSRRLAGCGWCWDLLVQLLRCESAVLWAALVLWGLTRLQWSPNNLS